MRNINESRTSYESHIEGHECGAWTCQDVAKAWRRLVASDRAGEIELSVALAEYLSPALGHCSYWSGCGFFLIDTVSCEA